MLGGVVTDACGRGAGIGKTSLIKSIVQTCEDIVHVDPHVSSRGSRRNADSESTRNINEVFASTRPYPHWWSEIDDNKVLRRRKSRCAEEQVIERNLCFVDTPGYGSGTSVRALLHGLLLGAEVDWIVCSFWNASSPSSNMWRPSLSARRLSLIMAMET